MEIIPFLYQYYSTTEVTVPIPPMLLVALFRRGFSNMKFRILHVQAFKAEATSGYGMDRPIWDWVAGHIRLMVFRDGGT